MRCFEIVLDRFLKQSPLQRLCLVYGRGLALFGSVFFVCLFVMSVGAQANDTLSKANTSLINGKYKDVVAQAGKVIAGGKQKPEIMAKALLMRGIAYRKQGKIAQSIADLSNAEWLQKLRGVELRRLYVERALAYEAVGQSALANKDRQLAGRGVAVQNTEIGGSSLNSVKKGVRTTQVTATPGSSYEFFGGLGNLFGFQNSPKKKQPPQVQQVQQVAVKQPVVDREIPTLESAEAAANRIKLQADAASKKAAVKTGSKVVASKKETMAPSNSAWEASRSPDALNSKKAIVVNKAPVTLTPKKVQQPSSVNSFTSFLQNAFGVGGQKTNNAESKAPLNPGDEVMAADQVASIEGASKRGFKKTTVQNKKPVWMAPDGSPAKKEIKVAALNKTKRKPANKPPVVKPASRSLYHIQLGVFGEARSADKFVNRLTKKYGSLIGSKTAMVVETDMGQSRRQYRVYVGPFRSREKGVKSCRALTQLGMGCSLVE